MNHRSFQGQAGIITGAAQGIGFALAQHLLKSGACLLLNDFDEQALIQAQLELKPWHDQIHSQVGDASDKSQVQAMVDQALQKFGRLDFVVANAGLTRMGSFIDFPESDLHAMLNLNIAGSFFLAQVAAKQMIKENYGRILFMSSTTGVQAHRHTEGYGMTKAALQMLAKNLAMELGPHGITVNCIAPGATLTPRTTQVGPEYAAGWADLIPTGRAASTDDIAASCLFLLGAQGQQINGQTLIIDGGWTGTSPLPEHI